MKLKRYLNFLNEDVQKETDSDKESGNEDLKKEIESTLEPKFQDLKSEIVDKIIKSLKTQERKVFDEFITAYIANDEKNKIQGLINDAGVNEFYLSYRDDINEILSDLNFFQEPPSKINAFNIDTYIVKATLKAIKECVIRIKEETSKKKSQESTQTSEETSEESNV